MKNIFRQYYALNSDETKAFWGEALIVFDANILLNLYKYKEATREDYFKVIQSLKDKDQIWLPHRVGQEFFSNRINIIRQQALPYNNLKEIFQLNPTSAVEKLKSERQYHPYLDLGDLLVKFKASVKNLIDDIDKLQASHPNHLKNDTVLTELTEIFEDSLVGQGYGSDELEKLLKDGEDRYSKRVPPGFMDADKKEFEEGIHDVLRPYGDLIVWKQILDKSKEIGKPIIFVTNDLKADWVQRENGNKGEVLGVLPALRKEIMDYANTDLLLYSSEDFLKYAKTYLKLRVSGQSIEEVEKYNTFEGRQNDRVTYRALMHVDLHRAIRILKGIKESGGQLNGKFSDLLDFYRNILYRVRHPTQYPDARHALNNLNELKTCGNILEDAEWDAPDEVLSLIKINHRLIHLQEQRYIKSFGDAIEMNVE